MHRLIVLFLSFVLSGCSLAPDFITPDVPAAETWSQPTDLMTTPIATDWWKAFGSGELDECMRQALEHNNDVLASLHRVEQSRANLQIVRAGLFPSMGIDAGTTNARTYPAQGRSFIENNIGAAAGVAYEVDLFGRVSSSASAAEFALQSNLFDSDTLRLIIISDVAISYFTLINYRERLAVADRNIATAEDILRIVRAQFDAGRTSSLEVAQQSSELASTKAARAALERDALFAENALAVLAGKAPRTILISENDLSSIIIPNINTGLPSDLLARRPDIAAAESRLRAANANIGAARAAFFPSLSLSASAGVAASGLGDPATTVLSLTSSLFAPIFEGGRLEGGVELAQAQKLELAENYRKTVLVAFREVEDALAAAHAAEAREAFYAEALKEAQTSYDISRVRHTAGSIDFQALLDIQRTLLTAEDNYTQSRLARLSSIITLYKALGGGWEVGKS